MKWSSVRMTALTEICANLHLPLASFVQVVIIAKVCFSNVHPECVVNVRVLFLDVKRILHSMHHLQRPSACGVQSHACKWRSIRVPIHFRVANNFQRRLK